MSPAVFALLIGLANEKGAIAVAPHPREAPVLLRGDRLVGGDLPVDWTGLVTSLGNTSPRSVKLRVLREGTELALELPTLPPPEIFIPGDARAKLSEDFWDGLDAGDLTIAAAVLDRIARESVPPNVPLLIRAGQLYLEGKEFDRALDGFSNLPNDVPPELRSLALQGRGSALRALKRGDEANQAWIEAASLDHGVRPGWEGASRERLGNAAALDWEIDDAVQHLEQAYSCYLSVSEKHSGLTRVLSRAGTALMSEDRPREAIPYFKRAKALHQERGNLLEAARADLNLGAAAKGLGDLEEAHRRYLACLTVRQAQNAPPADLRNVLANIGELSILRGDYDSAIEYCRQALSLGGTEPTQSRAVIQINLANAQFYNGDRLSATQTLQSALAALERSDWITQGMAATLRATIHLDAGRADEAVSEARSALLLYEEHEPGSIDIAELNILLGQAFLAKDDLEAADRSFTAALTLSREAAPGSLPEAAALSLLGRVKARHGDLKGAEQLLRSAIQILVANAGGLVVGGATQKFVSELHSDAIALANVLLTMRNGAEAFDTLLRSRGQSFQRELLASQTVGDSGYQTAAESVRKATILLGEAFVEQERSKRAATSEEAKDAAVADLKDAKSRLLQAQIALDKEYLRVLEQSPVLRGFSEEPSETLRHLGRSLFIAYAFDEGSGIVAFANGKERGALSLPITLSELRERVDTILRDLSDPFAPAPKAELAQLTKELLPKELAAKVAAATEVIVMPDADLWKLPFSCLVLPNGQFLGLAKPIRLTPQLSFSLNPPAQTGEGSAVFGGVPFSSFPQGYQTSWPTSDQPPDLPGSAEEARSIAEMHKSTARLGLDVSATAVLDALKNARLIHLATHSVQNVSVPLASAILVAPSEGPDAVSALTASDLASLQMRGPTVVLSACRTAGGRLVSGDSTIGLVRCLLTGGARSVVASMWPVEDNATRELMTGLHREIARGEKSTARGLLKAARALAKQGRNPYYWASFQVFGG